MSEVLDHVCVYIYCFQCNGQSITWHFIRELYERNAGELLILLAASFPFLFLENSLEALEYGLEISVCQTARRCQWFINLNLSISI